MSQTPLNNNFNSDQGRSILPGVMLCVGVPMCFLILLSVDRNTAAGAAAGFIAAATTYLFGQLSRK